MWEAARAAYAALMPSDVIAVPMGYYPEFHRDPNDALLRYGSLPQRSRMPYFTKMDAVTAAMCLPDQVTGPKAEQLSPILHYKSLVAARDLEVMLGGLSPYFRSHDQSYWHVHIDFALMKNRHGDAAGIAMGRIGQTVMEAQKRWDGTRVERVIRTYEIPLAAQIIAPQGDQIYLTTIAKFVMALKQSLGFNITSFSCDQFQSAETMQQLMLAGMVTAGMDVDPDTHEVFGLPKPWSVDGGATLPYRELLEGINDDRISLPNTEILRKELRELENTEPGRAPDHPATDDGSKDVADACAGVVGYLAVFGHHAIDLQGAPVTNRETLMRDYNLPPAEDFTVEEDFAPMTINLDA